MSSQDADAEPRKKRFNIIEFRKVHAQLVELTRKKLKLLEDLGKAIDRDYAAGKLPYQVREREKALAEAVRLNGRIP